MSRPDCPATTIRWLNGTMLSWPALMALATHASGAGIPGLTWQQLSPLPNEVGVAGAFAGVSGGALVVAGGANFPDKMPWEGGRKVWHDTVSVLEQRHGQWTAAGRLPRALGYGVSVSYNDSVVCVGGSDSTQHYADTFRVQWRENRLAVEALAPLPIRLANMAGALVGGRLYVAGGVEGPGEQRAANRAFVLDLEARDSVWREIEPLPGKPRMLAAGAAHAGVFYVFGGVALEPTPEGDNRRVYLNDAYCYRSGQGWTQIEDLPKPRAAAPNPAVAVGDWLLLLSGDDGSHARLKSGAPHPGFEKSCFGYQVSRHEWREVAVTPAPRVTVPCVPWQDSFVLPSGEVRPGVRSAEVWSLTCR